MFILRLIAVLIISVNLREISNINFSPQIFADFSVASMLRFLEFKVFILRFICGFLFSVYLRENTTSHSVNIFAHQNLHLPALILHAVKMDSARPPPQPTVSLQLIMIKPMRD